MIPGLRSLIYVRHLMKQDERKLLDLLPKRGRNIVDRKLFSSEIIKCIYGSRVANFYEYGIVEAIDPDNFIAKLDSLEDRWESFCPGFHQWFIRDRKSLFLERAIQSARLNSDSMPMRQKKVTKTFKKKYWGGSEQHSENRSTREK